MVFFQPKRSYTQAFFLFLLALVFFELLSRIVLSRGPVWNIIARGPYCETRYRMTWLNRQSRQGARISYTFDVFDATKGWLPRPSLRDALAPSGKPLSTNSRGIRGREEYHYQKKNGALRILALGDSFTFGEDVGDDETYCARLKAMLPDTEVINLGVHGYGHDQMLIYLREEGVKYHPDIVVLGFVFADCERNILTFRDFAKPRFAIVNGRLTLRNSPVSSPETVLDRERRRLACVDLLAILYHNIRWKVGLEEKLSREITSVIFDEMVSTVRGIGATPIFIYLPVFGELSASTFSEELTDGERFLSAWCKKRGVLYCSARPYFIAYAKKGSALKTSGHWGPTEHRLAAEVIRQFLSDSRFISDSR